MGLGICCQAYPDQIARPHWHSHNGDSKHEQKEPARPEYNNSGPKTGIRFDFRPPFCRRNDGNWQRHQLVSELEYGTPVPGAESIAAVNDSITDQKAILKIKEAV